MEAVEKLVAAMRKASAEEREALKQQLLELALGANGPAVREAIESCRKGELLEVQWELDDVLEATAPKKAAPPKPPEAPKPEAPPDPNRPLSAKDLTLVYDDPLSDAVNRATCLPTYSVAATSVESGETAAIPTSLCLPKPCRKLGLPVPLSVMLQVISSP